MKLKPIKTYYLFVLFGISLFVFFLVFINHFYNQLNYIKNTATTLLEDAIYGSDTDELNKNGRTVNPIDKYEKYKHRITTFKERGFEYDHYEDSILFFDENDEWEYRTFVSEDTIINRKVPKKRIMNEHLYYQSDLMRRGKIDIPDILDLYVRLLNENNIFMISSIFLSATSNIYDSIKFKNFGEEEDIYFNYKTPIYNTGYLDEISYQAFLVIPFKAVYRLIPKSLLGALLGLSMLALIIAGAPLAVSHYNGRKMGIVKVEKFKYHVGNLLFDFIEGTLTNDDKVVKLARNEASLLWDFIQNKNYSINKDILLDKYKTIEYMSTSIYRLREALKKAECNLFIVNSKDEYKYKLDLKENNTDTRKSD